MREDLINMAKNNVGSLCLFLRNPTNRDYLDFLQSEIKIDLDNLSLSEKIYHFVNSTTTYPFCTCGKKLAFIGLKSGYRKTCGDKECFVNRRKLTCIENWGVDNPKKSKELLEKEKSGIIEKWGGVHYMSTDRVKEKFKNTMLKNWGVEWSQQSDELQKKSSMTWQNNPDRNDIIKERSDKLKSKSQEDKSKTQSKKKETIIENWGSVDNLYAYINDRIRQKSLDNLGVEHHLSHPDVIKKRINSYRNRVIEKIKMKLPDSLTYLDKEYNKNETDSVINLKCHKCEFDFSINRQMFVFRSNSNLEICLHCNPILSGTSNKEIEVFDFLKDNFPGEIKSRVKDLIDGEIDIYIPDLKLAVEFNGLFWHSEQLKGQKYHLKKTLLCKEIGVELIHIWEDDWDFRKEVVKSILLNKLGLSIKIWARNCKVRIIDNVKTTRDFLEKNHIQGFVGSNIKIGLFLDNKLVSIMTFGHLRKSLGQEAKTGSFELLRFCNQIGTTVVGGASKLFKFFIDNFQVNEVVSYSDSSRGRGNLYEKLNFIKKSDTEPNFYWVINGCRKHRFNYRKDRLVKLGHDKTKTELEIMSDLGHYRIFDCGSGKWIWTSP